MSGDSTQGNAETRSQPAGDLKVIFKDEQYSFQALRALGVVAGGGGDIGECLTTLYRIKEGDDDSWYREWYGTAGRLEETARDFRTRGDPASAGECYLRASSYYRSAEFFLHVNPRDSRIVETSRKSRDCFLAAADLSGGLIRPVEIPFEGVTLPGYLCLADMSRAVRPLLVIHTGFDGTAEELYLQNATPALKRGINCLLFEGPGQGRVIREQHIVFRPDWETVVAPVVDFAIKQPEVDPEKIGLMGLSFGGYLAPRAAAFEPRIRACIANGGVYDFHANCMRGGPPGFEEMLDDSAAAKELDAGIYQEMKTNPSLRWAMGNGQWAFGAKSPSEWLRMTRPYTLKDCAGRIKCRMLVVDSENDKDMPGQARQLYDALRCPKDFMLFTAAEGAGEHCQVGAMAISGERILNWLQRALL